MKLQDIEIFADGSCRGNPGPGGWCAIILEKKSSVPFKILKGSEIFTTNNRMEMLAVIEALKFIVENKLQNSEINLYSDSNLIIQSLNQGWKRKANKDLWEELDELAEGLDVNYIWVKGHAKNKWNNECDKHAQSESLKASKKKPTGENILKKEKEDPQSTLF
ncbi:MAG: ribonuclease H [Candidatus Gracilibacteria bacterium]